MKKGKLRKVMFVCLLAGFLLLGVSCVTGTNIFTYPVEKVDPDAIPFTAILYHNVDVYHLKTVAFLDLEGDGYEVVPFGAPFKYTVIRGLRGKEAFRVARKAVDAHGSFMNLEVRAIKDPEGTLVGYELRPLYLPIVYGRSDVLDINYVLQPGGRITVYVKLKDDIERMLATDNGCR